MWRFDVNYWIIILGSVQINQLRFFIRRISIMPKKFADNSKFNLQQSWSTLIELIKSYAKRKTLLWFSRRFSERKLTSIISFYGTSHFCVMVHIFSSQAPTVLKFLNVKLEKLLILLIPNITLFSIFDIKIIPNLLTCVCLYCSRDVK